MPRRLSRTLTALLFLCLLAAGVCSLALGLSPRQLLPELKAALTQGEQPLSARVQAAAGLVEERLADALDRDHRFIELHGLTQRLLGRRVVEDAESAYTVAKLSNGALTFLDPDGTYDDFPDPAQYAAALSRLRERLETESGIPLLYVQAPQKASSWADACLPDGLTDYGDARANALLAALAREGVDTLDLRGVFAGTGRYDELFFRTDHHWTPEGAFLAWQTVAGALETDYGLTVDPRSTDPSHWQVETLTNRFLGSQGKRVGRLYAGMDDFSLWSPREEGLYQYLVPIQGYDRTGPFDRSLCFPERLEESDPYQANPYTYYSGGDYSFARMKNLQNPDGPTIVLLRDSFACALAPFMAVGVGEVVTIDLRYFQEELMEYIRWVEADAVLVLYTPGSLKQEAMFHFTP